jgi:hypothetical protein
MFKPRQFVLFAFWLAILLRLTEPRSKTLGVRTIYVHTKAAWRSASRRSPKPRGISGLILKSGHHFWDMRENLLVIQS